MCNEVRAKAVRCNKNGEEGKGGEGREKKRRQCGIPGRRLQIRRAACKARVGCVQWSRPCAIEYSVRKKMSRVH